MAEKNPPQRLEAPKPKGKALSPLTKVPGPTFRPRFNPSLTSPTLHPTRPNPSTVTHHRAPAPTLQHTRTRTSICCTRTVSNNLILLLLLDSSLSADADEPPSRSLKGNEPPPPAPHRTRTAAKHQDQVRSTVLQPTSPEYSTASTTRITIQEPVTGTLHLRSLTPSTWKVLPPQQAYPGLLRRRF